jgi:succinoglycan biosynthesis protein ExoU
MRENARDDMEDNGVAVVIAAHDASDTIGAAVRSALMQAETREVVVVDDASTDGTDKAAGRAANGDPRLRVLRSDRNIGPAAARNLAFAATTAPVLALLDADDLFLPGRLRRLLAHRDWDMIADNIAFVSPGTEFTDGPGRVPADPGLSALDLAEFVRGNLPRHGQQRGELGFLKPLIRRSFLVRSGLRYDPDLRLGEDYDLYVRALRSGARFLVSHAVGYVAHVRPGSLSGRHRTDDLLRLANAAERHLSSVPRTHAAHPSMTRLLRSLRARHVHRACLDEKARGGVAAALAVALNPPGNAVPIARGVLGDKLSLWTSRGRPAAHQTRVLIPPLPDDATPRDATSPSRA